MIDFHVQPTLKGHLIELRPLRLDDFDSLFAAASDPLIWAQHPEPDRFKREVFTRFFDSALESKGALVIIDRETGSIIGSSRYYDYKPEARQIKIGYTFLERAFWGGTYNGELTKLMLDHAFQFVDDVLFEVGEDNMRSQRALQKIGAQFVKKVELERPYGNALPCVVFKISRIS